MNKTVANRKIQAVVFDMDGRMFNTEDIYDRVGSSLLARRGKVFSLDLKRNMMGRQNREALQIMIDFCGLQDSVDELSDESNTLFLDLMPQQIEKLPGLEDLMNWLEQTGIPKAVATSSSRVLAEAALGHFDLLPRFEFVLTGDDVNRGKPDPEIYFAAANRFDVKTSQMLVLEDSVNGTRAAVAAGAVTIAVPGHHQDEGEFSHVKHIARALNAPVVWELLEAL